MHFRVIFQEIEMLAYVRGNKQYQSHDVTVDVGPGHVYSQTGQLRFRVYVDKRGQDNQVRLPRGWIGGGGLGGRESELYASRFFGFPPYLDGFLLIALLLLQILKLHCISSLGYFPPSALSRMPSFSLFPMPPILAGSCPISLCSSPLQVIGPFHLLMDILVPGLFSLFKMTAIEDPSK